ncbi:Ubiquitin carboxyl-terminal hydrolase 2 [Frankliniella fusca]|uniref:ubiquitinyl hydrolase 1 n=1 Tax=Frankliniella fusca TaxID=407009 RepID=A0AAE1HQN7_9NEOP|nr:Ubiquitin carboxyl-terminal hydrolase 2 [Frankliniella fusca]
MGDCRTSNILGHVGLENLGYTCFLNAALQCIHNIEEFRQLLLSKYHKVMSRPTPLTEALSMLFAEISKSESSVAPNSFLHVIRKYWVEYNPGTQQDAMDFLSFLLWHIHAEVLESEFVIKQPNIAVSA